MSYILEALRKAERERNLGQVPTLAGLPDVAQPAPRRLWPWMLAVAVAANVLVALLIYLFPRQDVKPPEEMHAAAPEPQAMAPADTLTPPTTEITEPEVMEPMPDDMPAEPAFVPPPATSRHAAGADTSTAGNRRQAPPVNALDDDVMREPAASTQEPAVAEAVLPADQEPALPADTSGESASGAENVPMLRDMPPDFRRSMQEIKIDAHFYSEDPARRFVMINLRKYHEGERLVEGPELERILSNGLVLSYQGQRFRMPLPR